MKYRFLIIPLVLSCLPALAVDPAGFWKGAIEIPGGQLAIEVELEGGQDENWSGTIAIPAQGLRGFALSNVQVEGTAVRFQMDGIPGEPSFDGSLSESGDSISGSFRQGAQSLTFFLERASKDSRPPERSLPERPVPGEGVSGEWLGALSIGPMKLRLALHVSGGDGEVLEATLESVDQGSTAPVDAISLDGKKVHFRMSSNQSSYNGDLNGDGSAISGTWTQMGRDLPLTFHRLERAFSLNRPQNPKPPFPYESREVTFRNETAQIDLAGTLIVPEGDGPFPTVLFVTGSGPQDRDESLMGHKPFLVIADHLARRGIGSLRYDDRGVGGSKGSHLESTVGDFATDVEAGISFLTAQPGVDTSAIGIIGHSEGALSGPKVAVANSEIDFLVLLAPPGEPLLDLLVRQTRDVLRTQGISADLIEKATANQVEVLALISDVSLSRDELEKALRERSVAQISQLSQEERKALQVDEGAIAQGIAQSTTPWFRSLMLEDPAVYLKSIRIPVLALLGEKDLQVAADVNSALIESSLKSAGNRDFQVRILPGLNHLFQHAETGAVSEYGEIEETFAPEALQIIADWIADRFIK